MELCVCNNDSLQNDIDIVMEVCMTEAMKTTDIVTMAWLWRQ